MRKLFSRFGARALAGPLAAALLGAAGCSYSHGTDAPVPCPDATATASTYAAVISPIFEAHCRECHGAAVYQTQGGGWDYSTHAGIKKQSASLILHCVNHDPGFDWMPKGKDKLAPCDIARLQAWIDAGQPDN